MKHPILNYLILHYFIFWQLCKKKTFLFWIIILKSYRFLSKFLQCSSYIVMCDCGENKSVLTLPNTLKNVSKDQPHDVIKIHPYHPYIKVTGCLIVYLSVFTESC